MAAMASCGHIIGHGNLLARLHWRRRKGRRSRQLFREVGRSNQTATKKMGHCTTAALAIANRRRPRLCRSAFLRWTTRDKKGSLLLTQGVTSLPENVTSE